MQPLGEGMHFCNTCHCSARDKLAALLSRLVAFFFISFANDIVLVFVKKLRKWQALRLHLRRRRPIPNCMPGFGLVWLSIWLASNFLLPIRFGWMLSKNLVQWFTNSIPILTFAPLRWVLVWMYVGLFSPPNMTHRFFTIFVNNPSIYTNMVAKHSLSGLIPCLGTRWEDRWEQQFIQECNSLPCTLNNSCWKIGHWMIFAVTYRYGLELLQRPLQALLPTNVRFLATRPLMFWRGLWILFKENDPNRQDFPVPWSSDWHLQP